MSTTYIHDKARARAERLVALGFDKTRVIEDDDSVGIRYGCSQCEALGINGHPTHETGCPNRVNYCSGCDEIIPRGMRYCNDCM